MEAFSKRGITDQKVTVYDDYAHHPTEIQATLTALRERHPQEKIWVVFEPHQYSRTRDFWKSFQRVFNADEVLIPDIYRVRDTEADVASMSAEILVSEIQNTILCSIFRVLVIRLRCFKRSTTGRCCDYDGSRTRV